MNARQKPIKIWDASGIINSMQLPSGLTIPEVISEIKDHNSIRLFELSILEPAKKSIAKIDEAAKRLNENGLSVADQKILALALEQNGMVMSDDNAVQNVAEFLDIPFQGNFFEIKRLINWKMYCTACEKYVHSRLCECGLPAIRKI